MSSPRARVVLADDEPLAVLRLRRFLDSEPRFEVVGEAGDGRVALDLIQTLKPDVVILDIRMPELDGLDVIRSLGDSAPAAVILTTALETHAVDAFEMGVIDYLLKPFNAARLKEALDRAWVRYSAFLPLSTSDLPPETARSSSTLALKWQQRIVLVPYADIERIEAAGHRSEVFTKDRSWVVGESLGSLTARLPPGAFFQASRFTLIHINSVEAVVPKSHGDQIAQLRSGARITVSRTRRSAFIRWLGRTPD